jgi:GMP synthase-like glutamine amidotransferase
MRRALIIRHHVEDDAGLVGRALIQRGFELHTILVNADNTDIDFAGCELIVVLGSNSAVYDPQVRTAWLDEELVALRRANDADVAILGVCFGAQALCALFGGTVERADRSEEGWFMIDVVEGASISPGPWFEYHGDRCNVPEVATVLARTPDAVQVFTIGRHVAVQFHPEIDDEQLSKWFASETPEARAHSPRQRELLEETRRETPEAAKRTAKLVEFFLDHAGITL